MSETPTPNAGTKDAPQQLPVHFVKSTHFRVIHADGVWFGGDPNGHIHLSFFNERTPIPEKIIATIDKQGEVAEDQRQRITKDGIEREVEVDVVLTLQAAIFINNTLGENLKNFQEAIKSQGTKKL